MTSWCNGGAIGALAAVVTDFDATLRRCDAAVDDVLTIGRGDDTEGELAVVDDKTWRGEDTEVALGEVDDKAWRGDDSVGAMLRGGGGGGDVFFVKSGTGCSFK